MMKQEFEKLAGYEVSVEDYNKVIEPMYMATDLDKESFVKVIDRKRFELKKEKTEEQKAMEAKLVSEIAGLKKSIEYEKLRILHVESYLETETETEWIKEYKRIIKRAKEEIKCCNNRIKEIRWVLA